MIEAFDLESLVHVEQTYILLISLQKCKKKLTMITSFYDLGYQDGFAPSHGHIHGLIEGRELGREKGFEMWEEIGFYEGFALTWRAILRQQSKEDELS
jgi:Essential protein Yae1, N terminal